MEILLHLPMEPVDFPEQHPGPGALFREMSGRGGAEAAGAEEPRIRPRRQGREQSHGIPSYRRPPDHGNSHGGAQARESSSSSTAGHRPAASPSIRPTVSVFPRRSRDIFLDAHDDEDFIRGQVKKLLERARSKGRAIGIGHPYGSTFSVLEQMIGRAPRERYRMGPRRGAPRPGS